jgi:hypothetical protein
MERRGSGSLTIEEPVMLKERFTSDEQDEDLLLGTLGFGLLKFFVFPAESLDTTCRIHQLLLSGVEGMALGADFHADFLFCGAGGHLIATHATDDCVVILGMNIIFHVGFSPFPFVRLL